MTLVLVAHGTRSSHGAAMLADLAEAVAAQVEDVRLAFVDVLGPSPAEVLRSLRVPAVLVPVFLSAGFHVRVDVPREVASGARHPVTVTPALGPDPVLAAVLAARLAAAGWRAGDDVVLAAAGSNDPRARAEIRQMAGLLADLVRVPVAVGYIAAGTPRLSEVLARPRAGRVFIASYLLARGLFQDRVEAAGAEGATAPLGADPEVVDLVVRRLAAAPDLFRRAGC